jgi:regulatory protein
MFHVKHRQRVWTAESLHAYALRLLSYRARSREELLWRFRDRGAPEQLAQEALQRLADAGLVDDEAFARRWVESRRRASPRGDRLLRSELARKGLPRRTIDEAMSSAEDQRASALAAAQKKARALTKETEQVFGRRLTDFLLRRGFEYETVASVVREVAAARVRE